MRLINKKRLKRKLNRFVYKFTLINIRNRNELPHILNSRKLIGKGVEIGVYRGHFSQHILKYWNGKKLYSVDPWVQHENMINHEELNPPLHIQENLYKETLGKLSKFGDRSEVLRLTSKEASNKFQDNELDFVYIDAQHQYEAINEDIHFWYPKLRHGGILCGHDYRDGLGPESRVFYGVKKAVDEFVMKNKLTLYISKEAEFPSWFIIKPKYNR